MTLSLGKELGLDRNSIISSRSEFGETDNSFTYPELYSENLTMAFANVFVNHEDILGSPLIYNNPIFGIWGSPFKWTSRSEWLAAGSIISTRVKESNVLLDWMEFFEDTEFKASGSAWDGSGSIVLSPGDSIESSIYTGSTELTNYRNVRLIAFLENEPASSLYYEMSTDNGSNWTQVDGYFSRVSLTTGSQGKEVKFRITNSGVSTSQQFPLTFPITFSGENVTLNWIRIRAEGTNYIGG